MMLPGNGETHQEDSSSTRDHVYEQGESQAGKAIRNELAYLWIYFVKLWLIFVNLEIQLI